MWSPSFRCPHCKTELTHSLFNQYQLGGAVLVGTASASGLLSSLEFFLILLIGLIVYEYYRLNDAEILIFDDIQRRKYEERIYVSPKFGPVTAFLAIFSGILLLLFGLVFTFLINDAVAGVYWMRFITFFSGAVAIIVGVRINRSLSNKSLKNGTREEQRAP